MSVPNWQVKSEIVSTQHITSNWNNVAKKHNYENNFTWNDMTWQLCRPIDISGHYPVSLWVTKISLSKSYFNPSYKTRTVAGVDGVRLYCVFILRGRRQPEVIAGVVILRISYFCAGWYIAAKSGRIKGVTDSFFADRRKIVQRPPLTVAQIIALESTMTLQEPVWQNCSRLFPNADFFGRLRHSWRTTIGWFATGLQRYCTGGKLTGSWRIKPNG
jgi:hypothetical protein